MNHISFVVPVGIFSCRSPQGVRALVFDYLVSTSLGLLDSADVETVDVCHLAVIVYGVLVKFVLDFAVGHLQIRISIAFLWGLVFVLVYFIDVVHSTSVGLSPRSFLTPSPEPNFTCCNYFKCSLSYIS